MGEVRERDEELLQGVAHLNDAGYLASPLPSQPPPPSLPPSHWLKGDPTLVAQTQSSAGAPGDVEYADHAYARELRDGRDHQRHQLPARVGVCAHAHVCV